MVKKSMQPTGSHDAAISAGSAILSLQLVEAVTIRDIGSKSWIDEKTRVKMEEMANGVIVTSAGGRYLIPWSNIRAISYVHQA